MGGYTDGYPKLRNTDISWIWLEFMLVNGVYWFFSHWRYPCGLRHPSYDWWYSSLNPGCAGCLFPMWFGTSNLLQHLGSQASQMRTLLKNEDINIHLKGFFLRTKWHFVKLLAQSLGRSKCWVNHGVNHHQHQQQVISIRKAVCDCNSHLNNI